MRLSARNRRYMHALPRLAITDKPQRNNGLRQMALRFLKAVKRRGAPSGHLEKDSSETLRSTRIMSGSERRKSRHTKMKKRSGLNRQEEQPYQRRGGKFFGTTVATGNSEFCAQWNSSAQKVHGRFGRATGAPHQDACLELKEEYVWSTSANRLWRTRSRSRSRRHAASFASEHGPDDGRPGPSGRGQEAQ